MKIKDMLGVTFLLGYIVGREIWEKARLPLKVVVVISLVHSAYSLFTYMAS